MLTRIIITGIVIALVIMLYRKLTRAKKSAAPSTPPAPAMKKCAHCGVHLPPGDAIQSGEHFYCSEQHRLQHEKDQSPHD